MPGKVGFQDNYVANTTNRSWWMRHRHPNNHGGRHHHPYSERYSCPMWNIDRTTWYVVDISLDYIRVMCLGYIYLSILPVGYFAVYFDVADASTIGKLAFAIPTTVSQKWRVCI